MPPPRRQLRRSAHDDATSISGLSGEDEGDEGDGSSDEELRAMANIRRRRQQAQAAQARQGGSLPKVRLRMGGREGPTAALVPHASPPKLRLKLSGAAPAAAAQPQPASGGGGRAARGRTRWQLGDDLDDEAGDDVAEAGQIAVDGQLPAGQPGRATSLKLKVKFGDGGAGIPQVDGTAEDEDDEGPSQHDGRQKGQEDQQGEAEAHGPQSDSADAGNAVAAQEDTAGRSAAGSAPEGVPEAGSILEVTAAEPREAESAAMDEQKDGEIEVEDKISGDDLAKPTGPQSSADGFLEEQGRREATDAADCNGHPSSGEPVSKSDRQDQTAEAARVQADSTSLPAPATSAGAEPSHVSPDDSETDRPTAAASAAADAVATGAPPAEAPGEQEQARPHNGAGAENKGAAAGEAKQQKAKPLSPQEKDGLPALVNALRRWIRELGGRAPTDVEDPEVIKQCLLLCHKVGREVPSILRFIILH